MADKFDYSLLSERGEMAVETGLATAQWYHTEVSRKEMKALMRRSDQRALIDTAIWIGSMIGLALIVAALWPSWWSIPFLLIYGVLYASAGDSRWHECGHGTAFKTRWMNTVVYHIASFMIVRNPVSWRWSHARHHTDTMIVGRDPEIAIMRPPAMFRLFLNVFGLLDVLNGWSLMINASFGKLDEQEKTFIPESEHAKVVFAARIWSAIYFAVILLSIATGSLVPVILVILPKLYGSWHVVMTGMLQHAGLAEDVLDHRLNTRTVYMNRFSRFVYWNMNYHVEHHMFPMVPYHALPELHALIKDDLPAANLGILDAFREVWPALLHQLRYEDWFIKKELPPTAKPYRAELHGSIEPPIVAAK